MNSRLISNSSLMALQKPSQVSTHLRGDPDKVLDLPQLPAYVATLASGGDKVNVSRKDSCTR